MKAPSPPSNGKVAPSGAGDRGSRRTDALQAELERRGYSPAPLDRATPVPPGTGSIGCPRVSARPDRPLVARSRMGGPRIGSGTASIDGRDRSWPLCRFKPSGAATAPQPACRWRVHSGRRPARRELVPRGEACGSGSLPPERRRLLWASQVGLIVTAISLGGLGATWEGYTALGAPGPSSARHSPPSITSVFFAALGFGAALLGLLGWLAAIPRLITDEPSSLPNPARSWSVIPSAPCGPKQETLMSFFQSSGIVGIPLALDRPRAHSAGPGGHRPGPPGRGRYRRPSARPDSRDWASWAPVWERLGRWSASGCRLAQSRLPARSALR